MSKRREAISRAVADLLEIPKDLALDLPRITMVGKNELGIENHRGIIEYTPQCLRVNLNRGYLEIEGEMMEISVLMPEELVIIGEIHSLRFLD